VLFRSIVVILGILGDIIELIFIAIEEVFGGFLRGIGVAWDGIVGTTEEGTGSTLDSIEVFLKQTVLILDFIRDVIETFKGFWVGAWNFISGVIETAFGTIGFIITQIIFAIANAIALAQRLAAILGFGGGGARTQASSAAGFAAQGVAGGGNEGRNRNAAMSATGNNVTFDITFTGAIGGGETEARNLGRILMDEMLTRASNRGINLGTT